MTSYEPDFRQSRPEAQGDAAARTRRLGEGRPRATTDR